MTKVVSAKTRTNVNAFCLFLRRFHSPLRRPAVSGTQPAANASFFDYKPLHQNHMIFLPDNYFVKLRLFKVTVQKVIFSRIISLSKGCHTSTSCPAGRRALSVTRSLLFERFSKEEYLYFKDVNLKQLHYFCATEKNISKFIGDFG